jgi:hypothetical protein
MVGLQPSDKVTLVTFSKPLSLLERMLIKSMRDNGIMARLAAGLVPDMLAAGAGSPAAQAALPQVLDALRRDGTLAAVALLDGRPIALMPFWLNLN